MSEAELLADPYEFIKFPKWKRCASICGYFFLGSGILIFGFWITSVSSSDHYTNILAFSLCAIAAKFLFDLLRKLIPIDNTVQLSVGSEAIIDYRVSPPLTIQTSDVTGMSLERESKNGEIRKYQVTLTMQQHAREKTKARFVGSGSGSVSEVRERQNAGDKKKVMINCLGLNSKPEVVYRQICSKCGCDPGNIPLLL